MSLMAVAQGLERDSGVGPAQAHHHTGYQGQHHLAKKDLKNREHANSFSSFLNANLAYKNCRQV